MPYTHPPLSVDHVRTFIECFPIARTRMEVIQRVLVLLSDPSENEGPHWQLSHQISLAIAATHPPGSTLWKLGRLLAHIPSWCWHNVNVEVTPPIFPFLTNVTKEGLLLSLCYYCLNSWCPHCIVDQIRRGRLNRYFFSCIHHRQDRWIITRLTFSRLNLI